MANQYYSGQGRLYYGNRVTNALGVSVPDQLIELGNCPNLEVSVEITKFEHKESQSGSRAVDLTVVQEKKGTFTMTLESLSIKNLALAFWGTSASNAAVTAAQITTPLVAKVNASVATGGDTRIPIGLGKVGVTNVTITSDLVPTITYQFGETDADVVNSKNGYIDEKNGVIVIYDTAKQTSRTATAMIANNALIYVDSYDQVATQSMEAFTQSSQQKYLRFEGLNTIDNKAVIIDIYKADLDPLSGYGLINEEIGSVEITGAILLDDTQPQSSQFFKQTNVV